ncbi:DNA (cytosine-5)-methyltransferase DRM2-like [Ananas comosus]|uniref:DNA (cytosine-5-)-methyltransferase n=1 Tax=Ananas comosus TaxID=4615 RepID=A0A6P5FJ25_ANACO|nr:DNA (cytosine-5)-methyltransferase DRM2-like [Ananas comosus]
MDWVSDSDGGDEVDWESDGEGEEGQAPPIRDVPSSSEAGSSKKDSEGGASKSRSNSNLTAHFVAMGFSEKMVAKAIKGNGEGDSEAILELLLTYGAIDKSPSQEEGSPAGCSSPSDDDNWDEDDNSDLDDFEDKDFVEELAEKDKKLLTLVEMGFTTKEAASAIERCGQDAPVSELADSIYAAQTAETDSIYAASWSAQDEPFCRFTSFSRDNKRRKFMEDSNNKRRRYIDQKNRNKNVSHNDDDMIALPNPMIGFGLPTNSMMHVVNRRLPEAAIGPPYFYYENVALAPKGVWATISRFLYDIEPEFVDSKYFCAAARKRGYIHNLPIENRFPLLPMPPKTIHEAFPLTKKWWPSWDHRTQFNCLQTCIASAKLTERIRRALIESGDLPSPRVQQYVLNECRKWNLVWVGLNKVAPLEPDEIEYLLGFPRNHTRGISRTERYRSLGNSFQVDTVAYHLSVLKDMFPNGLTVLSLFSGIGGAEVALHRLGVHMKTVVSVEISEINRNVLRSWWEQTNQTGKLIEFVDVQQVNSDRLEQLISTFGGFDLVIGGSPCNNLAGSNRHSRDGLEGEQSALFYHYFRILDLVKCIMGKN